MMKPKKSTRITGGIVIRKFSIEDYESLIELWDLAGLPHKPAGRDERQNIEREIHQPNAVFLVAERKGCLIGSAFGTHDGRKGWINRVAVLPSYRRQGIAAALVNEVEEQIKGMGISIIACLVEDWNEDSLKFFEKMGYIRHKEIFYLTKREGPHT